MKALKVRRLVSEDFNAAFGQVDLIASPVAPTPAFKLGELVNDPLAMYLGDIYTIAANLAGIPGLSIPAGLTPSNLPVGLQLLAPPFEESVSFACAPACSKPPSPPRVASFEAGSLLPPLCPSAFVLKPLSELSGSAMNYTVIIGLEVHVQLQTDNQNLLRARPASIPRTPTSRPAPFVWHCPAHFR